MENNDSKAYGDLSHMFLELRSKGIGLSPADYEILATWKALKIAPSLISNVMLDLLDDCQARNKSFPTSLSSVHKAVMKRLKALQSS